MALSQLRTIQEGSASLLVPKAEKISRKMEVFYNPVMKLNRDTTILLLKQFPPLHLCDPLAGTGVRSIRFAKELRYKSITANDLNPKAVELMKLNMKRNAVQFTAENRDANLLLLESKGFDYIDLDVFGSPNFLLDLSILAITATDTAPLAGTYPKACLRKYWAVPRKDATMHETGIRILIRKVQLIAAQYDKALLPIFSYFKGHYYRVFFRVEKGKKGVDLLLKQHGMHNGAGPLWLGKLWDPSLAEKMFRTAFREGDNEVTKLLNILRTEAHIESIGFHHLPSICKKYKLPIPKKESLLKRLKAAETHFTPEGLRSSHTEEEIRKVIERIR